MTGLDLATAEYIGARAQQQDLSAAVPTPSGAVLVLADGLGGHESGAEAARLVVETFREAAASGAFDAAATRRGTLRETVERTNQKIAAGADPAHGHRGMASTVVAAVLAGSDLSWVSVGDSHLYLWRNGRLSKLNEDHSQAGLMVRSGQYKPDDPEVQAVKSVLVSALTGRKLEIVDLPQQSVRLEPGDVVMLASDGLNTLEDAEIEHIVGGVRAEGAVRLSTVLLETVRDRRIERQDNTTVAVARVLGAAEPATGEPVSEPRTVAHDVSVPLMTADEARTERIAPAAAAPRAAEARDRVDAAISRAAPAALGAAMEPAALSDGAEADGRGSRPDLDPLQAPTEKIGRVSPLVAAGASARARGEATGAPANKREALSRTPRRPAEGAGSRAAGRPSRFSTVVRMILVLVALLAVLGALLALRPDLLDGWLAKSAVDGSGNGVARGAGTDGVPAPLPVPVPARAGAVGTGGAPPK